jgi:hypothetical protein
MTSQDLESFKDFILERNPYFSTGYANAFKDGETSGIYARVNGNLKSIFPDDRVGNYFYLRNDPNAQFISKSGLSDCGSDKAIYDDRLTVYLVAIVNDADEFSLISNLRNTSLLNKGMIVIPTGAMWLRENVVLTEMSGFEDEDKMKALARLKGQTIVRLQLQVTKEFIPSKCIINPCKECN